MGTVLHTLIHLCSPQTRMEAQAAVKQALLTAMHATHCASHGSLLNLSPDAVTFWRDMFLDIPLISDVLTLQEAHQEQVDQHVLQANASQFSHDWNVNDYRKLIKSKWISMFFRLMHHSFLMTGM